MLRRRLRRVLLIVVAATAIVVPFGSARGQQYQGCQATVSQLDVTPGQTIVVTGSGAEPTNAGRGAAVSASLDDVIGRGTADAYGNFSFPAVVPGDLAAGSHILVIDCANGATSVAITAGYVPERGLPIPYTGAGMTFPVVRAGLAFCAIGALALAATRRRRWADHRR